MYKKLLLLAGLSFGILDGFAQRPLKNNPPQYDFPDSVYITIHPSYNQVNGFHKRLFGENYRKEWATNVKLPLIRVSQDFGGLSP